MASQWPPVKNAAYSFEIGLYSQADSTTLKSAPTLAAGDFKVSVDGGAPANTTNTPSASGTVVTVALTQTEMNHDRIFVVWVDAAGAEWIAGFTNIFTTATSQDGLATPTNITAGTITTTTNLTNVPTAAMTESYSTDGSTMTLPQALYEIKALLSEFSVSGLTITTKRVDGSTTAATYTIDSATAPTSMTRAS